MTRRRLLLFGAAAALAAVMVAGGAYALIKTGTVGRWHAQRVLEAERAEGLTRIIFLHHSVGANLIEQGGVREAFAERGYHFWDHGYNEQGLKDPFGNRLRYHWDVPNDNTDPDGLYAIFNQPVTDPPGNTFSQMLQYDVIAFKSCYPAADIESEAELAQYQEYYRGIRAVMDRYPDKLFIPMTPPPLVPNMTRPDRAAFAQRWAAWLTSDEFAEGRANVRVFDLFGLLADDAGYLRAEYRWNEDDSHPNALANQTVGPLFVEFVDQAVQSFKAKLAQG